MAVEPFRKPRGQDAKAAAQHVQSQLLGERVGDLLGQAREQRGESLADVGKSLRIRQPYLEAIERGDHDALPGLTYAIGFVRAYAAYLELDVPDMVRRYKEEAGTQGAGADLHFPTPLPEGRIPTRAILVLALLLTALAYVGWWWFTTEDRKIADLIPALPSSISNLLEEPAMPAQPATQPQPDAQPSVSEPEASDTPASSGMDTVPAEPAGSSTAATQPATGLPASATPPVVSPAPVTVPTAQAPAASVSAAAPATVTPAPAASAPVPAPAVPAPVAAPSSAANTAAQGAATSAAPAPQRTAPTSTLAPSPVQDTATVSEEAESDTAPPDPEPIAPASGQIATAPVVEAPAAPAPAASSRRVFGAENSGSRIEVTATGDAWVEFRDAAGQLVFTRVLREGDVYHVPNQPGLRLQTGNAGALSFKVDGAVMPSIGPSGSVRRNVLIEPGALQSAGTETQPAGGN